MSLPEIPLSWLVALLLVGMVVLRCVGIDTWTTAAISSIMGYILAKHVSEITPVLPVETTTYPKTLA